MEQRRGSVRWWIASAGCVGLYAALALVVRRAPDNSLDRRILDRVSDWDAEFLDRAAEWISWITDTEPRIVMAIVGLVGIAATRRFRFVAAVLLTTALTAIPTDALDDAGGVFTGRERPNGAPFKAYPSGHTLGTITQFGFSIYLAIRLGISRWLLAAVVVVLGIPMVLVGPARLVRGVHWPTDVIGSYLLGAGSLIAAVLVFEIVDRWLAESPLFGFLRSATGKGRQAEPSTPSDRRHNEDCGWPSESARWWPRGIARTWPRPSRSVRKSSSSPSCAIKPHDATPFTITATAAGVSVVERDSGVAETEIAGSKRDLLAFLLGRPPLARLSVSADHDHAAAFKQAFPSP